MGTHEDQASSDQSEALLTNPLQEVLDVSADGSQADPVPRDGDLR